MLLTPLLTTLLAVPLYLQDRKAALTAGIRKYADQVQIHKRELATL